MKKSYIVPSIVLVKTNIESAILAGSFDDDLSSTGVNSNDITSKKNKGTGLWDEAWETPEDDEQ